MTAASSAASGSSFLNPETEHSETSDANTFPISCFLDKDDRGVYTLSGSCCLCGQTFRAVGCVVKGNVLPWHNHARLQHNIVQHARTHGAVGYTPRRNLDEMRLDWVRSPGEASKTEHSETCDVNTFPISCFLGKDARGVYTLSGSCCLCSQTFRAVGCVVKGNVLPWNGHARLQHRIVQHARTHGAVGYTPHRNLDEMRLDWVRSPAETSEVMAAASASGNQKKTKLCAGCAKWRRTTQFRHGASTCRTCLKITYPAQGVRDL